MHKAALAILLALVGVVLTVTAQISTVPARDDPDHRHRAAGKPPGHPRTLGRRNNSTRH